MGKVGFLFPGQGAFYAGALDQAKAAYVAIEQALNIIEQVALRRFGRSLTEAMRPERGGAEGLMKSDPALLQLAIFAVSVAAHESLRSEGVRADVMMGHSFGEIAALTCAGAFTFEQGANIVCDRVEALDSFAPSNGCMAAVMAGLEDVRGMLSALTALRKNTNGVLAIAVENHDRQTVVSGLQSDVMDFVAYCSAQKISAQRLNSPYGFHHPNLAPVTSAFADRLARYPAQPLQCRVYSPILGRYYDANDSLGDCLARHLTLPVQFSSGLRFLHTEGVRMYVECGALDALTRIGSKVFGGERVKLLPVFFNPSDELSVLRQIVHLAEEMRTMTNSSDTFTAFETFWRERSPFMLLHIKTEFERFLATETALLRGMTAAPVDASITSIQSDGAHPAKKATVGKSVPRQQLFEQLVGIYAEAMEYPREVITETVELEAELGIDSVKQTEIMGRVSALYGLPPLPTNVRMSDYKTLGQITDFVFTHQNTAVAA